MRKDRQTDKAIRRM